MFNLADALVLGLVIIIIAIFRYADRNNRSYEKLKRFTEKVQADLSKFTQEKAQQIQDLGIQIDVQHRSATKAIEQLELASEELSKRESHIEEIQVRINSYDRALNQLLEMTNQVEKNISAIQQESEYIDSLGRRIKETKKDMTVLNTEMSNMLSKFKEDNTRQLAETNSSIMAESTNLAQTLKLDVENTYSRSHAIITNFKNTFEDSSEKMRTLRREVEKTCSQIIEESLNDVKNAQNTLENTSSDLVKDSIYEIQEQNSKIVEETLGTLKKEEERVQHTIDSYRAEFKHIEENFREKMNAIADKAAKFELEQYEKWSEELSIKRTSLQEEFAASFHEQQASMRDSFTRIEGNIRSETGRLEKHIIENVEQRLNEYSEDIHYRLARIDELSASLGLMDEHLRSHTENLEKTIEADLQNISDSLKEQQEQHFVSVRGELDGLKNAVQKSEEDLLNIKKLSENNISEHLGLFEKEFYKDLQTRKESLDAAIVSWTENFMNTLNEYKNKGEAEQQKLEGKLIEESSTRIEALRAALNTRIEDLGVDIQGREDQIRETLGILEERIANERSSLDTKFRNIQTQSQTILENRCQEIQESINERLAEMYNNVESGIKNIDLLLAGKETAIKDAQARIQKEQSLWYEDTKHEQNEIRNEAEAAKREMLAGIEAVQKQLRQISEEFNQKHNNAIKEFNLKSQEYILEISGTGQDSSKEVREAMQQFRTFTSSTKQEFEVAQKKLIGHLNTEVKNLNDTMREIQKKQRDFLQQTRLFDRADSLKNALTEDIDKLKSEINRFTSERKQLSEYKNEFIEIRNLGEEANKKIQNFAVEYRKLENIEDNYKRIISLSESLDKKLEQVNAKNDNVQRIQLTIQNLDKLQHELDAKHLRLSQRMEIFDATIGGVDRNFQQLNELDERNAKLSNSFMNISNEIDMLKGRLESLSALKSESDIAMRNLRNMNELFDSIEDKKAELHKAREWIARSETRILELSESVDKKIEILGTASASAHSGAQPKPISGSEKVMVVKLKQQGWKIDDIARTCKISRGEVELILEMAQA